MRKNTNGSITKFFSFAIVLTGLAFFLQTQVIGQSNSEVSKDKETGWFKVTSIPLGFETSFPSKPSIKRENIEDGMGKIKTTFYYSEIKGGFYLLVVGDLNDLLKARGISGNPKYKDEYADAMFDEMFSGISEDFNENLDFTFEGDITLNGIAGKRYELLLLGDKVGVSRMFISDSFLYWEFAFDLNKNGYAQANRFSSSLRLF